MTKSIRICVLLLLAPIAGCTHGDKVKGTSPAQSRVDVLAAKLEGNEIGRIEIFEIPPEVLTRIAITPEALEKQFDYKLTIRDIRGGAYQAKLIEAMKSTVVQPRSDMADIRWGIVFYGIDETRVAGVYFDKWGGNGAVDSTPVSFKGDLFKWLDGNFSDCFR